MASASASAPGSGSARAAARPRPGQQAADHRALADRLGARADAARAARRAARRGRAAERAGALPHRPGRRPRDRRSQEVALPPPSAALRSDVAGKATAGAVVIGGLGGAGGGGGFRHLARKLRRYVNELRGKGLDVVFVIDGTASMGDVLALVRRDLESLVEGPGTGADARIGFVVYRDRSDAKPIEIAPLTASRSKLAQFLQGIRAEGRGDWPESSTLGLAAALERMAWNADAKRIVASSRALLPTTTSAKRPARPPEDPRSQR